MVIYTNNISLSDKTSREYARIVFSSSKLA